MRERLARACWKDRQRFTGMPIDWADDCVRSVMERIAHQRKDVCATVGPFTEQGVDAPFSIDSLRCAKA